MDFWNAQIGKLEKRVSFSVIIFLPLLPEPIDKIFYSSWQAEKRSIFYMPHFILSITGNNISLYIYYWHSLIPNRKGRTVKFVDQNNSRFALVSPFTASAIQTLLLVIIASSYQSVLILNWGKLIHNTEGYFGEGRSNSLHNSLLHIHLSEEI